MNNRVVHFEIQAGDTERAIKFYQDVFGWDIKQWGGQKYWIVMTAPKDSKEPGLNGGLLPRMGGTPVEGASVNAYVCSIQVDSYDEVHDKILKAGGVVALPKYALPGMAWQGYYKDTEGNIFGVHQSDVTAK